MKRRVLVTGGAGFVGSHACKALALAGFEPVAFDSLERGNDRSVRWGPLVRGNVCDRKALLDAFDRHDPVAVLHFAAYAYVGESVDDPALYYRNNVVGTLTLLEAMREHGCHDVVFSSSCATYGVPSRSPISEDETQVPINPYGRTKLIVEQILGDMSRAYGTRYVALRYFNAAGADPDGELGEEHEPETHLLPLIISTALGQRAQVAVFGDDYPTPDGTAVRDYVHVSDLARAHVLALEHLLAGGKSLTLNLGAGRGHSVREMIAAVERVAGGDVATTIAPRRQGDPPSLIADAARARDVLGWAPELGIDVIVQTAWDWFASHRPRAFSKDA